MKTVAIVLAAGNGSRMKSEKKKQYLLLGDRPVLWYSLRVFQENPGIDGIVLVCGDGEEEKCRKEYVENYGFSKIRAITAGGKERYHSVYEGLMAVADCDRVLIHDGARPFVSHSILGRIFAALEECSACVVGVPAKNTIKKCDEEGYVEQTLPRENLWTAQTPQAFSYLLIRQAYEELLSREQQELSRSESKGNTRGSGECISVQVTDDAMVVEAYGKARVKLIEGSYENIKITTPEDMILAEQFLDHYR